MGAWGRGVEKGIVLEGQGTREEASVEGLGQGLLFVLDQEPRTLTVRQAEPLLPPQQPVWFGRFDLRGVYSLAASSILLVQTFSRFPVPSA